MPEPREALYYERLADGRVRCTLCPHLCHIADGYRGACGVRLHHRGRLVSLVYDRVVARHVDPIEKKPLYHFLPGSTAYSIATVGCALSCAYCQNWEISQWPKDHLPRHAEWPPLDPGGRSCPQLEALERGIPGEPVTPHQIVEAARLSGARSIAYTYTEPTVFFELAYDTAVLARRAGLKNVLVTSGFITEAPLRQFAEVVDAVNVDLKYARSGSYLRVSKARLGPVLEAIRLYHELGVWVEVTTLVVPGINDSDLELRGIASFVRSLGEDVPWHVTRFLPAHRMMDRPPTPLATLERAHQIGLGVGLRYVYEGNTDDEGEDTRCHACGTMLIRRRALHLLTNRIRAGRCPVCGEPIPGIEMDGLEHPAPSRGVSR